MTEIIVAISVLLLIGCAAYFPIWARERRRVRRLTVEQLTAQAFRFETDYFEFIGLSEDPVVRFRKIAESHDLAALSDSWKSLSREFRTLERKAGHRDRPLLFDYYYDQDAVIAELMRRRV